MDRKLAVSKKLLNFIDETKFIGFFNDIVDKMKFGNFEIELDGDDTNLFLSKEGAIDFLNVAYLKEYIYFFFNKKRLMIYINPQHLYLGNYKNIKYKQAEYISKAIEREARTERDIKEIAKFIEF